MLGRCSTIISSYLVSDIINANWSSQMIDYNTVYVASKLYLSVNRSGNWFKLNCKKGCRTSQYCEEKFLHSDSPKNWVKPGFLTRFLIVLFSYILYNSGKTSQNKHELDYAALIESDPSSKMTKAIEILAEALNVYFCKGNLKRA